MRGLATTLISLSLFVLYSFAVFYPFDWDWPSYGINPIQLDPEGGLASSGIGVARTRTAPEWLTEVIGSGKFTIRLSISTSNPDQFGPARIMTISKGHSLRNLTVAQDGRDLIVLLRTIQTDLNGEPGIRVEDVFGGADPIDIELAMASAHLSASVNNHPRITIELPPDPFKNWSKNYRLALGNEFDPQREAFIGACRRLTSNCPFPWEKIVASDDKAWIGKIHSAEIGTETVLVDYAKAGQLTLPNSVVHLHQDPELIPFFRRDIADTMGNLLGFIPFGFLIGRLALGRHLSSRLIIVGCITLVASLSIESAQLFLPSRSPSITDVLMNTLGSIFGSYLSSVHSRYLAGSRSTN